MHAGPQLEYAHGVDAVPTRCRRGADAVPTAVRTAHLLREELLHLLLAPVRHVLRAE
jgi:hypothetical protein